MSYHTLRERFWFDEPAMQTMPAKQLDPTQQLQQFLNSDQDCAVQWGAWSQCYNDKNEKGNDVYVQSRSATVTAYPRGKGATCPALTETKPCTSTDCKVGFGGVEEAWSDYSNCFLDDNPQSPSYNKYIKLRTREVIQPPIGLGKECPTLIDTAVCAPENCSVKQLSETESPWSNCYQDVDKSFKQVRKAISITSPARYGGSCAESSNMLTYQGCAPINCEVSDWTTSDCYRDPESGKYVKLQSRTITKPAAYGGSCPGLTQTIPCEPIACSYNDWTDNWSSCYRKDDGKWYRFRTREVKDVDRYGGTPCDSAQLAEEGLCPATDCSVSGEWKDYSGVCYTKQDGLQYKLQYKDFVDGTNGGRMCEDADYIREVRC
jgi:hypothetical protein